MFIGLVCKQLQDDHAKLNRSWFGIVSAALPAAYPLSEAVAGGILGACEDSVLTVSPGVHANSAGALFLEMCQLPELPAAVLPRLLRCGQMLPRGMKKTAVLRRIQERIKSTS